MRFSRQQIEGGMERAVTYFILAVGAATGIEAAVILGLSRAATWPSDIGPFLGLALIAAILAVIIAGIGAIVIAVVLGIGLTALASLALRHARDWRIHLLTYFGVGVLASLPPVGLFLFGDLADETAAELSSDWLTNLDAAVVILIAGVSVAAAWYRVWRATLRVEAQVTA